MRNDDNHRYEQYIYISSMNKLSTTALNLGARTVFEQGCACFRIKFTLVSINCVILPSYSKYLPNLTTFETSQMWTKKREQKRILFIQEEIRNTSIYIYLKTQGYESLNIKSKIYATLSTDVIPVLPNSFVSRYLSILFDLTFITIVKNTSFIFIYNIFTIFTRMGPNFPHEITIWFDSISPAASRIISDISEEIIYWNYDQKSYITHCYPYTK
jgi:hypothetical protein